MTNTLPGPQPDPAATRWSDFQERYAELQAEPLDARGVSGWLQRWSDLQDQLQQTGAILALRADQNTADEQARQAYDDFVTNVVPPAERASQALRRKLLAVPGYEPPADQVQLLRRFRAQAERFREANVELEARHEQLMARYGTISGAQAVQLGGETLTVPAAEQRLGLPGRDAREEAWRAVSAARLESAPQFDDLMRELLPLRRQLALNADLSDFRAYQWAAYDRVDYTPRDCLEFHDAVEAEVVPLARELLAGRREQLGLASLRPWDYTWRVPLDAQGREPLRPFGDVAQLEEVTQRVFGALDAELGEQFALMRGGYLDLASRPNKMTHAYCTSFPVRKMPFVLMNVVGTSGDVQVLLHEMGHAFHGLASMRAQSLTWNTWSPTEFVEVPSQAMELLALPHLARDAGGFYTREELGRLLREQLHGVIYLLPWVAQMDAFQHWLYAEAGEHPGIEALDAKWAELHERFQPHTDWAGLEDVRAKGWHYYHIFRAPFYYIEYGFSWLGALDVWRSALRDPHGTMQRYKQAMALGSTRSVPELYRAAGSEFRFDRQTVGQLMRFVREQLPD